ncbi:MAG TPA: GlsB/YeaQ/YmgE family stress response membrane protein [Steroidobacteraceae bacterium]|nr:GlsB/YeaQ/YmgE family stress response membrane protein [Steroidobacteraceae bacterium]
MDIITWLVIGWLVGWVASIVMRSNAQQGMFLNVVVGTVGAAVGGWLSSPLLGVSAINQSNLSFPGVLVSLLGAVILLSVVNVLRRGATR